MKNLLSLEKGLLIIFCIFLISCNSNSSSKNDVALVDTIAAIPIVDGYTDKDSDELRSKGYQILNNRIAILNKGKFELDQQAMDLAKEQNEQNGLNLEVNSFSYKENEITYRIQMTDYGSVFSDSNPEKKNSFINGFLKSYSNNLNKFEIEYTEITYFESRCLQYTVPQDNGNTRAIIFFRGNDFFLIQLTTSGDIDLGFNTFLANIELV